MTHPVFVGDAGTEIVLDCGLDVSNASVRKIIVKRPDGKRVQWDALLDGTRCIKYVVQANDIDVDGSWDLQAYIELPAWRGKGSIAVLEVKDSL